MTDLHRLQESAEKASAVLKAMANQRRLLILCQLAEGEKSVGELEALVKLNQSALSQHLAILRQIELVQTRRVAQTIYYSLSSPEAAQIMQTLYDLYCSDSADSKKGRKTNRSGQASSAPRDRASSPVAARAYK